MVIILLPNGTEWFKANWAFRQLAADVDSRCPDHDIRESLERAEALGVLDLKNMGDQKLVVRLMGALRDVAQDTVDGVLSGWRPEDRSGAQMYRDAMVELAAAIDKS